MGGEPRKPAAEGAALRVNGEDVGVWTAEEGSVGEDGPEVRSQTREKGAALDAVDGGVSAAAVEEE